MAFHGRASHLPRRTQTLLLVAAADHTGDPDLLLRGRHGARRGRSRPAARRGGGLVAGRRGRQLRFRHPLVRAAIHQRAPLAERLAAHRALAGAADPVRDPDHRAWHLAAAATGPDEAVATALEATAGRARERSGHAAAAAAYERAARLSTDPAARIGRLLLAAESAAESPLQQAGALADRAVRLRGPQRRARGRRHPTRRRAPGPCTSDALAEFWQGAFPAAHRMLTEGAELVAGRRPGAGRRGCWCRQPTPPGTLGGDGRGHPRRLAALESAARTRRSGRCADFLTRALGRAATPHSAAPPAVAGGRGRAPRAGGRLDPRDLVMLCGVGLTLGQDAAGARR